MICYLIHKTYFGYSRHRLIKQYNLLDIMLSYKINNLRFENKFCFQVNIQEIILYNNVRKIYG